MGLGHLLLSLKWKVVSSLKRDPNECWFPNNPPFSLTSNSVLQCSIPAQSTKGKEKKRVKPYRGELSFFTILRWKRDGAKHTAIFMGVIWFSSTDVTSCRKHRRVCSTTLFSSDINMMAACTACSRCSFGTSEKWHYIKWITNRKKDSGNVTPTSKLRTTLGIKLHFENHSLYN